MFTAELCEAVIGADEKVVATDMVIVVIRRAMGRNGLSVEIPLQLDSMWQMLPGKYCAVMDLSLVKLGCGTTEYGVGFALVVALAVTVEEGDIANTGPAIFYQCGRMELGHNDMVLNYFSKLRKILRRTSECVRFWTDAGLLLVLIRTFFILCGVAAGAEEFVLRLHQVDPGFESVGISCAVDVCMALRRSELMDGGSMDGLIAWEDHVWRIDV